MENLTDQLVKAVIDSIDIILNGFFTLFGVAFGCFLDWQITKHLNRPQLIFAFTKTPDNELTDSAFRVKTDSSELSVQIINAGRVAVYLEKFLIFYRGHLLVECCCVSNNYKVMLPDESIIYTLMEQDADAMRYNYLKYYRDSGKVHHMLNQIVRILPILRNFIDPEICENRKCIVVAYSMNGKRTSSKIDLPLLYLSDKMENDIIQDI